jgi:hypothetical protein
VVPEIGSDSATAKVLAEIALIVFPPEPPVAKIYGQNGAQPARARLLLARRSEPLPASTVLAPARISTGGGAGTRSL